MFLWNTGQLDKLVEKINSIEEIIIIHPIFELENSQGNNVKNIVTIPYLRGFAYFDGVNLVYTGIGCHKVGGILMAVRIKGENDDRVAQKIKDITTNVFSDSLIIALHDVPIDFFSQVRIRIQEIKNKLPGDLEIELSPVITSMGRIEISRFYSKKMKYNNYDDAPIVLGNLINKLFEIDSNFKKETAILVYYKQDRRELIDKRLLQNVTKTFNVDNLREWIKGLFITMPKKVSYLT